MIWLIVALVAWVACGVLAAGFTYAYFQREFPSLAEEYRTKDARFACVDLFLGPIGLLSHIGEPYTKHGWLWPGSKP